MLINTEDKEFRNAEDTKLLNSEDKELRNAEDTKLINSKDKELINAGLRNTMARSNPPFFVHFSPVVRIGTPHPLTRRRVCPPPLWFLGRGHSRLRERGWGGGGVPVQTRDRHCGSLGILYISYAYFVS
jgi:hypothetical protein